MLGRIEDIRFPGTVRLLALAILFVSALALFTNAFHARQMDFISFWAAGKLSIAGNPLAAYDIAAHKAVQSQVGAFERLMPFPYPPAFLLVATPLALLPYGIAAFAWVAGTFALYLAAARRVAPGSARLAAAFPPVLVNGIIGQNGLLTGAMFMWGMTLLEKRSFQAGLVLGCLILKPQLGVLLPVAFIAARDWQAFAGAAASSAGLCLAALLAFGPGSYLALAEMMPLYGSIAADGLVGWHKMASVYASLRMLGFEAPAAWAAHWFVALAAAAIVWKVWRSHADVGAKAAVLAAGSVLISPYIYLYDTILLLLPLLWLLKNGEDQRLLALLWLIPLVVALQNWGFNQLLNPAPILPMVLLLLVQRRTRQTVTQQVGVDVSDRQLTASA